MVFLRRRSKPVPRLVGRAFHDAAPELELFLRSLFDAQEGQPAGFFDTTPTFVEGGVDGDAGEGTEGWAAANHTHELNIDGTPGTVAALSAQGAGPGVSLSGHTHRLGIPTAKGGLITHNGTDPIDFPVGVDGDVLTADSTEAAGVRWSGGGGSNIEADLLNDCISIWRLIEASGDRRDSLGVNDLTPSVDPGQVAVAAPFDYAAQFVAASGHGLYIPHNSSLDLTGANPFTMAVWVRLDLGSTDQPRICGKGVDASPGYVLDYFNVGVADRYNLKIGTAFEGPLIAIPAPTTGVFRLLITEYDPVGTGTIWIMNTGASATAAVTPANFVSSTAGFAVGVRATSAPSFAKHLDGTVHSVLLWRRLLTPGERSYLWGGGDGHLVLPRLQFLNEARQVAKLKGFA